MLLFLDKMFYDSYNHKNTYSIDGLNVVVHDPLIEGEMFICTLQKSTDSIRTWILVK